LVVQVFSSAWQTEVVIAGQDEQVFWLFVAAGTGNII